MYKLETKDTDYMTIVLTHKCRRACPFCTDKYRGREEYITIQNVEKALKFAIENRFKDIILTGGEPTEHPNVVKIAKKIKEYGFNLILTTNYDNPSVMKELDGIVDSFNVSYYGQTELPNQLDYKSDITLSTIIWQERFSTMSDLDKFIDKYEKRYYLKFSTLNFANDWCVQRKNVDYLDDLPNSKFVRAFEFHVAQIYRGHVILRCDRPAIKNNVKAWKMFPDGEITNVWTRTTSEENIKN